MLRILRAFAWMRWRVVVNSLERTSARDTLQRFSLAVEQIGPLLAAALFIPSALSLAAMAGYTGYALATYPSDRVIVFEVLRFLLVAAVALSLVGPIMLPAGERTNAVRLLLLPIPRPVLYLAQAASSLADPWNLLVVPVVVALPVGLAIGGAAVPAFVAAIAGILLLIVLIGISSVATLVFHLVMRDRRRGELLALVFVLVLPLLALLPGVLQADDDRERLERPSGQRSFTAPGWLQTAGTRAFAVVPSELYRKAIAETIQGAPASALLPIAGLSLIAFVLHGIGLVASGRMLDSPASSGERRTAAGNSSLAIRLPGLSSRTSAVAINQMRLAVRTPRGRSTLISPLLVFVMFIVLMWRGGSMDLGFLELENGLALATFGSAVCLLSILPFAMNQFAIDGAGLTMQFLSPLSDIDILIGKAVGNGLITFAPAIACVLLAGLIFPGGSTALWLSVPLGLASTYMLAAPAAAATSAIFPRAVDLNSIGSRSNAHGLAGLIGLVTFVIAAAPALLLVLLAIEALDRPALAPVMLLVWCVLAAVISRALLGAVARLVQSRRENLALVI